MRTLRASELGSFLYCQRSWWYQRLGVVSGNQGELTSGSQFHQAHARQVKLALVFKGLSLLLLLIAVIVAILQVLQ